jgi:energy-coupling factor transport system permease protein
MPAHFDLYAPRHTWLHHLDPRTKIAFAAASFAVLLPARSLVLVLGYLVAVHLLLWRARILWRRVTWLWRQMLPLTLVILILWPLSHPSGTPVLVAWWRLRITLPGLRQGLVAALRVNGLAFAAFILLLTTRQTDLVQGLVRLGLPFEWGLTLALGLRYLPLLYGTYGTITDAQRARGWTPEQEGLLRRLRAYGPTLVALIIAALRLIDQLTFALAARGLRPGHPRTTWRPLRLSRTDRVVLTGLAILTPVLLALELLVLGR